MGKTVDERVVQMKFDNRQFEQGVSKTMSTLDKFKQKLNLTGASKGLDDVQKSAQSLNKNMSFDNAEKSLASLEKRFSTLGIVGMTVIQNLTNSMMNFAKKVGDYGIGGIIEGGKSRAMKIENAKFQIKGLIGQVEDAQQRLDAIMDDVNYGVESTAYGLDAAATVAAQLVASGMEAGDGMRAALRGISGVAAMTNSSYEEIGRIYTTVAGNGRLMGDQLLQLSSRGMNAAAVLADAMGTTEAEVRQMVSKGQISFEQFSEAMNDAFGEHAKEANKTLNGVLSNIKAALAKIGADFFTPLIEQESPLIKFLNSVRERINDLRKALSPITKEITTEINNIITVIDKLFKERNTLGFSPLKSLLELATKADGKIESIYEASGRFADKVREIERVIDKAVGPVKDAANAVNQVTDAVQDYQEIVDQIIYGTWGNGEDRFNALTEAGINYYKAQNMVNEQLDCSFRYSEDLVNQQDELLGINKKVTNSTEQLDTSEEDLLKTMQDLSDEQLKEYGMTDDQVAAFRELDKMAKKTGLSMSYLLDILKNGDFSTRFLIFNSIKNIGSALFSILKSIAKAFTEVFSIDASNLFEIIAAFHKFTVSIKEFVDKNAEGLTNTLKGIFSLLHMITSIISGAFKIATLFITEVLNAFGLSILDVTGYIGNIIQKIDQWLTADDGLITAIRIIVDWMSSYIIKAIEWIRNNEKIQEIVEKIKNAIHGIGDGFRAWVRGLQETKDVPKYLFEGLINGIKENGPKVWEAIKSVALGLVETIKKALGIHSPSKVMFEVGENIIKGLINGIKSINISKGLEVIKNIVIGLINFIKNIFNSEIFKAIGDKIKEGFSKVIEVIKNIWPKVVEIFTKIKDKLKDFFKNVDFGQLVALGVVVGSFTIIGKLLDTINKAINVANKIAVGIANLLDGITKFLGDLGTAAKDIGKGFKYNSIANVLKSVAILIGTLVAAIVVLGGMDKEQLKQGGNALGILMGVLAALYFALSFISSKFTTLPDVGKILAIMLGLSASVLILSKALQNVASIKSSRLNGAIGALMSMIVGIGIFVVTLSQITKYLKGTKNIEKLAIVVLAFSASMIIIAKALQIMDSLNDAWSAVAQMVTIIGTLIVLLTLIAVLQKFVSKDIMKSAGTLIAVGVCLYLLAKVAKMAATIEEDGFKNTGKLIGCVLGLVAGLMAISYVFKGTEMIKVSGSILAIALAIGVLAFVAKLIGNLKPEELTKGLIFIGVLSLFVGGLILVSKQSASLHGTTLLGVAVVIGVMAAAAWLLGQIELKKLAKGVIAVGFLTSFMALLLKATENFKPGENAVKTLIVMTVMIGLLAGIAIALTFIEISKLAPAVAALDSILLSLAAVIYTVGKMKVDKSTITTLLTITLVVGALAGIIYLLTQFTDTNQAMQAAAALSLLLLAVAGTMAVLGIIGESVKIGFNTIAALAVIVIAVGVLADILKSMGDADNAIKNALALSLLMIVMTAVLAALGAIGEYLVGGLIAGVVAFAALTLILYGVVGVLASMEGLKNAYNNALTLSILIGVMTLVLAALGGIGFLAVGLIGGIIAFGVLTALLQAVVGVLASMENLNKATDNSNVLIKMIEAMTECLFKIGIIGPLALIADVAILGLIQAIAAVGTLATAVGFLMEKFPSLEKFLNKGLPILEQIALSIGKIFGNVIGGFINGVASELPHLGKMLSDFAILSMPFFTLMTIINGNKVLDGIKSVALSVLALCGAQIVDGITRFLGLGRSFVDMGKDLSEFGNSVIPFLLQMAMVPSNATDGIKNLAQAMEALSASSLMDAIGNKWFGSDMDMSKFGPQMTLLGIGIKGFAAALGDGIDNEKVKAGAEAVKTLAEATKELPNEGGLWQKLVGQENIQDFADKIPALGQAITDFCNNLGDNLDTEKVKSGAEAVKTLADAAGKINNEGGLWQKIVGKEDLTNFSNDLPKLATGIAGFADGLKETNLDTVKVGTEMIQAIADLGKEGGFKQGKSLEEFGACFISFCNKLTEAIQSLGQINGEDLPNQLNKIKSFGDVATEIVAIDKSKLEEFGESVKGLGSAGVDAFVNSMTGDEAKGKAKDSVYGFIDSAKDSVTDDKKQSISDKFKEVGQSALDGLRDNGNREAEFEESGKNFVEGFARGINNNIYLANQAASALGRKSVESLNKSVDEHSPSKITAKSGRYFTIGFINGINEYASKAGDAAASVGSYATKGLQNAVSKVYDAMSSDIDNQPTIRPVLDLSEIEAGASTLNSMLDINKNLALSANLSSISTSINRRLQNRGNDDVISAIKDLSKSISGNTGDTYNVNGINYSDDAEISDAIRTLVKASVVERRT